jgi:primosomal protein N' (replication factor Y) (superfamily II helicase)
VFADIAIPKSAPDALTYRVPEELLPFAVPGVRVRVPIRKTFATGVIVGLKAAVEIPAESIRSIEEILDEAPLLPQRLMDIAEFVSGYYRCPLGTTLASMIPARLFRPDAEEVQLTPTGAALELTGLDESLRSVLAALHENPRLKVPTLLARTGLSGRGLIDAMAESGWIRLRRRRRDRAPRVEVMAVALPTEPLDDLLERCSHAPRQRQVIEWLSSECRPALASEVQTATGCSIATLRTMVDRGLLHRFSQRSPQRPRWSLRGASTRHTLTDEQAAAVDTVNAAVTGGGYAPFLLHGVTGSGKTEVYIRVLETVLAAGRGGIVLVPEIGLTPAASGAVEQRFGRAVAVLHSAQSDGDRWREWSRLREGEARIVVGPRSALFAPIEDLGLIVVDEEQDSAYKQQEAPRYHARDLALVLGRDAGVPVLLCSATPSAESSGLVQRGLASKLVLSRRVAGNPLPEVALVDLRQQKPEPGEQGRTLFSQPLKDALAETIDRGEQAILLIQRRGWAPVLMCRDCGHRIDCPSCSVAMVVHRRSGDLRCHYCSHHQRIPSRCPSCSGLLLDPVGAGTEKVAHYLAELHPDVTSVILDRDTVRRRDGLEKALGTFAAGDAQVLVGTQMVAKGHHFPGVTLTGVISADALLNLPDFRSGERTFQLLTQVAGRAGRGDKPGRVIIQTYYPDHPAVRFACHHDVDAFLEEELVFRRAFAYPPAARLALVRFESRNQNSALRAAEEASQALGTIPDGVRVRGPAPAPIERIRDYWRWQILFSARNRDTLRAVLERAESPSLQKSVRRIIDVDPLSTL